MGARGKDKINFLFFLFNRRSKVKSITVQPE